MERSSRSGHRVAVVQQPPVYLDRGATLARAAALVAEAAGNGARLVALPESFVPCFPIHGGRLRPTQDAPLLDELHARLLANAVNLQTDDLRPLRDAARQHGVTVVCGLTERDSAFSRSTLYNTVVVIGPQGDVLNRHRKLMPTNAERMVWGLGDASGLRVVDTPSGRVAALICFENYMPLSRFALYAQGIELYLAPTVSASDRWVASMQHIAFEGGCWVLGCGYALQARDIPDDVPGRSVVFPDPDEWVHRGGSAVVDPAGQIVAGPMRQEYGILYADCDPARVAPARRRLDVAGHYSRPDVFRLQVRRAPSAPAEFLDGGDIAATWPVAPPGSEAP